MAVTPSSTGRYGWRRRDETGLVCCPEALKGLLTEDSYITKGYIAIFMSIINLYTVVHGKLDGVRGHVVGPHFIGLQLDIAIDEIIGEDIVFLEKVPVFIEVF